MIVTDAAIAAVSQPSRGPLRTLFALLGLSEITDNGRKDASSGVQTVSPPDWQQARVAAHRAVSAAERGDLSAADVYFTTAFTLDRALNPGQIANFWNMSLSGLETAERALRSTGRYNEAAKLANDVAFRYAAHPARQPSQVAS